MVSESILARTADLYGTPTYLYNLNIIQDRVGALRSALPDAALFYAVKANPCGAVLRHLAGLGVGAEVITEGELARALRTGVPAERVLLGGPRQDAPLVAAAQRAGVGFVSLDSLSQWEAWRDHAGCFLVRVNPALDPRTHEHLATGAAESKFGMPVREAVQVASELGERLEGFHIHAGSQIGELEVYNEIFALLKTLYDRFQGARTLDLGGGFAVPGFPLEAFAQKVRGFVSTRGLRLFLEPGRFLVADSGVLLTRVLHVKNGPVKHIIADAGMADLLRPALYGAQHPVRVLGGEGRPTETVDLDGPLCENADRLGRGVELSCVRPGDLLAVEEAGAYGLTMASNYASSLRPAEVVLEGDEIKLARRRETVEDLWRLEDVG